MQAQFAVCLARTLPCQAQEPGVHRGYHQLMDVLQLAALEEAR